MNPLDVGTGPLPRQPQLVARPAAPELGPQEAAVPPALGRERLSRSAPADAGRAAEAMPEVDFEALAGLAETASAGLPGGTSSAAGVVEGGPGAVVRDFTAAVPSPDQVRFDPTCTFKGGCSVEAFLTSLGNPQALAEGIAEGLAGGKPFEVQVHPNVPPVTVDPELYARLTTSPEQGGQGLSADQAISVMVRIAVAETIDPGVELTVNEAGVYSLDGSGEGLHAGQGLSAELVTPFFHAIGVNIPGPAEERLFQMDAPIQDGLTRDVQRDPQARLALIQQRYPQGFTLYLPSSNPTDVDTHVTDVRVVGGRNGPLSLETADGRPLSLEQVAAAMDAFMNGSVGNGGGWGNTGSKGKVWR